MLELKKLADSHKRWVRIVESFGCNKSESEDVVQDAYLKIHDRLINGVDISYGEEGVNEFYMYMTLRSIFINQVKKKTVWRSLVDSTQENLDYHLSSLKAEYTDVDMEAAYQTLINKIFSEVNSWDFYSRNMFIAYFTTDLSLTKLSEETGIGRSSLYNSVVQYKNIIQEHFAEDVEDFNNNDYDKI